LSQTSPFPSLSKSSWPGFATNLQLSVESGTPSPSVSIFSNTYAEPVPSASNVPIITVSPDIEASPPKRSPSAPSLAASF